MTFMGCSRRVQNPKDPFAYTPQVPGFDSNIMHAPDTTHARLCRIYGQAFTPKAVEEQAAMLVKYAEPNFARPEEFIPERWLADTPIEFRNDKREAFQPFMVGPRGCLGKEYVCILARHLYTS
jgi:cytochrome P450